MPPGRGAAGPCRAADALLSLSPDPRLPAPSPTHLARAGAAHLAVYDVQGRLVRTLHDGALPAGPNRFVFDGCDDAGGNLGSGVYFAWLRSGDGDVCRKMVLLK